MGLFRSNYDKPGPGIEKDAPPKRGFFRFWEILVRDLGSLVQLNLLYQGCLLPSQALLICALLFSGMFWPLFLLSILAAFPLGAAKTATSFCITKMLRDDPGFLWHDFKKAFKENLKQTMLVGMVHHGVTAAQIVILIQQLFGGAEALTLAVLLVSALVFHMVMPYYYVQAAYIQLGNGPMLKNALLLSFSKLPRSLVYALLQIVAAVAAVLLVPASVIVVIIIAYSLVMLVGLMLIWPPVDQTFHITQTLQERAEEE